MSEFSKLLEQANLLYKLATEHYSLVRDAIYTDEELIEVTTKDVDGNDVTLTLPSFSALTRKIDNLSSQFTSMLDFSEGAAYSELIDVTGKIRALFSISYDKKHPRIEHAQNLIRKEETLLDDASDPLNEIFYPWIKTKIDLTNKVRVNIHKVNVLRYSMSLEAYNTLAAQIEDESITNFNEFTTRDFEAWLTSNSIAETDAIKSTKEYMLDSSSVRYYGDFDALIVTIDNNNSDVIQVRLSTIRYSDSEASSELNRELQVFDRLVSKDKTTVFEITSLNPTNNTITVKRLVGHAKIIAGTKELSFLDQLQTKFLHLPVKYQTRDVIFIAPIDFWWQTIGDYSQPLLIDTSDISVIDTNNAKHTIDEFLVIKNGQDIGQFIRRLAIESNTSTAKQQPPAAPTLTSELFEVGVINEHIVNNADAKQVKKLFSNKKSIKRDLDKVQQELFNVKTKLDSGQYKNLQEKRSLEQKSTKLAKNTESKMSEFKMLITSLNENDAVKKASKNFSPKYRIQGFWPETDSNIMQYVVQYRYVAKTGEISRSKTKKVLDGNTERTGTFTAWQEIKTKSRVKTIDENGNVVWQSNNIADADQININQVEIPISPGENVEIRIKAISAFGQPFINLESEWSNIVNVEFPESLEAIQDLSTVELELREDLRRVEFDVELENKGVNRHLVDSTYEQNKYFSHSSHSIASGFFTQEQSIISLFELLSTMNTDISQLKSAIFNVKELLQVSLIDSNGAEFTLHKDGITEVFAGYYTEAIGSAGALGDIITKNYYVKLSNLGTAIAQIYSILPGNPADDFTVTGSTPDNSPYYDVPVGYVVDSNPSRQAPFGLRQFWNMIVYQRKRNFANNADLIDNSSWSFTPLTNFSGEPGHSVNATGNYVHQLPTLTRFDLDASAAAAANANLIGVAKEHPLAAAWIANANGTTAAALNALFTDFTLFDPLLSTNDKASGFQSGTAQTISDPAKVLFDSDDKYLIGAKTVGAHLTLIAQSKNLLQITQNQAFAGKAINPGASNALSIPLIFQYRMTDYTQTPGGFNNPITNLKTYEISKTIGIDLLILGQIYKYDIRVTAKYTPKSLSLSSIPTQAPGSGIGASLGN